ncbi:DUF554 family protein [Escherichia fergusonii]|uniref:DUF554 family protein n=1 Tax=Escherichia fergusonii TaxID=564 RepID=UPI0039EB4E3B
MVIGPFINAAAVLIGGALGAIISQRLPERIRVSMTSIFGLASLGIGILLVVKCVNLPAMVLATLIGALIGEFCYLEKGINGGVAKAQQMFSKPGKNRLMNHSFKIMWQLLCCFVPAAPGFSVQ